MRESRQTKPTGGPASTADVTLAPDRTGRFVALAHDFEVHTDHAGLAAYLRRLLEPFAHRGAAASRYTLVDVGDHCELWFEHERLVRNRSRAHAVATLLWHVNREVVDRSKDRFLLLHAAGAARDGSAVVLPAPMEAGKTTLVAGLVRAGFDYLSDEVVALDPATLDVTAYPKPLSLDPGSWAVLPELAPTIEPGLEAYLPQQWQVPADAVRPAAVAARASPVLVVLPQYAAGAPTRMTRLRPADALLRLMDVTFGLHERGAEYLPVLGHVVARCPCFALVAGDLESACAAVEATFASLPAPAGG